MFAKGRTIYLPWGEGGYGLFLKKNIPIPNVAEKKYSDFGGGNKNNLIQSFCHITKNINIRTLVLSEIKFLNETKNHNPHPHKLNGRSLTICSNA